MDLARFIERMTSARTLAFAVFLSVAACGGNHPSSPVARADHETGSLCDDGADNDEDGFVDCDDLDCRAESDTCPFAPALDRTVPTNIVMANEFLYKGKDPVQKELDRDALEKRRFAVIKGSVIDERGEPLRDVRVSIKNHPEFGYTLSRFDGKYDLVVNGGGNLVLAYEFEGRLRAERVAATRWLDYTLLPEVGLVEQNSSSERVAPSVTPSVEGPLVEDEYGSRQPLLVFEPRTRTRAVLPDGSSEELPGFELSITEYPFEVPEQRFPGQSTRFAPGSRFDDNSTHYSLDFSVAEAEALGAERVEFSKPVAIYVENFLGLPVGLPVRTEYYNPRTSSYETEFSGRIIEILDVNEEGIQIDADGDGEPESKADLEKLGFFDEELQDLARRYESGDTLWRTEVSHFSAFTLAWEHMANGSFVPNELPKILRQHVEQPSKRGAVQVENLAVREGVELIGTPFGLVYQTDRTLGYGAAFEFDLPLLGSFVPSTLKKIFIVVEAGGKVIEQTTLVPPFPKEHHVVWDGKDADGRLMHGQQKTKISIGYGFDALPRDPKKIEEATAGPTNLLGDEVLPPTVIWREHVTWLGVFDSRGLQFGGFGIDAHHSYDPVNEILYYGYGEQRSADNALLMALSLSQSDMEVFSPVEFPDSMVVDADGTLFLTDDSEEPKVWKITQDGDHEIILGTGAPGAAGEVELVSPQGIALDTRDGSLFLVDFELKKLFKRSVDGSVETLVGPVGSGANFELDLEGPDGVAISPDGEVFFADFSVIFRMAGSTPVPFAGQNPSLKVPAMPGTTFRAENIDFEEASGLAFDKDSNLFVSSRQTHLVYKIDRDGDAEVFAGTGSKGFSGDGGPAAEAELDNPRGIAVRPTDNTVFIADQDNLRIRRVGADGVILTLGGGGSREPVEPQPATDSFIARPDGIAFTPDAKTLYVGAASEDITKPSRLIKLFNASPFAFASDHYFIPSNDGAEVYQFDEDGRHLDTRDAMLGVVKLEFRYDDDNLLERMRDLDGLETTVERNGDGLAKTIIGPFEHSTRLRYDDKGALKTVTNDIREVAFEYDGDKGLVKKTSEAEGLNREYEFDSKGRVKKVKGPTGYEETYIPQIDANVHVVSVTPPNGGTMTYDLNRGAGSITNGLTFSDGDGGQSKGEENQWGSFSQRLPGGQEVSGGMFPLMPWGGQVRYLIEHTLTTASGRSLTTETQPSISPGIQFDDFGTYNDPFEFDEYQISTFVNDHTAVRILNKKERTITTRTPAGRTTVTRLNSKGRATEIRSAGFAPTFYTYDSLGRVDTMTLGEGDDKRTVRYDYGDNGLLSKSTDVLDRELSYTYEPSNRFRMVGLTRPDTEKVSWRFDDNNNVLGITPAGQPEHVFVYENGTRLTNYFPASSLTEEQELERPDWTAKRLTGGEDGFDLGEIRYTYDDDNRLKELQYADGRKVRLRYSLGNRVQKVEYATNKSITYGYNSDFSEVRSIVAPDCNLSFGYDSPLMTSMSWSGQVSGSVNYDYDDYFRLSSIRVNSGPTIEYSYDADAMLTGAGDLLITREADTGLVSGTALGNVSTLQDYNDFGELTQTFALFEATVLLNEEIERDALGRIEHITELKQGETIDYDFDYNEVGRLVRATIDGVTTEYDYDENGNRRSETVDGVKTESSADFDDRIEFYGDITYTHTPTGDLIRKARPDSALVAEYDTLGSLKSVTLEGSDGSTKINYLVDGLGRRVGRKVGSSLTHRWLYRDNLHPIAEIAPSGAVTRFVYGERSHTPAYMIKGSDTYRIISDHLGSVRVVVDTLTGAVVQELDYDAFGKVLRDTNPGFQPFGFAGGLYDPATQLVKFGVRDYDPEVGRFLTKDSMGLSGGLNPYAYAANDPVNFADPTGHWIDIVIDVGFIAYDIYRLAADGPEKLNENLLALGADVAGALIPGAVGLGMAVRASKAGTKLLVKGGEEALEFAVKHGDELVDTARRTGAVLEGTAEAGSGFGKLADKALNLSEKGLAKVEKHLAQFGDVPENAAMIARLRAAMSEGRKITGADASFYMHELSEATIMARGKVYEVAHAAALKKYGVSPFSVYAREVVAASPHFSTSPGWVAFWGL